MPTILIVEDEVLFREGVQEVLELHGFVVICAAAGQEALALLATVGVDLVITDLAMPNMDGVDFVQQVKARFPELPVIVASGCSYTVGQRLGIESFMVPGAVASIGKPFRSSELLTLVRQVVSADGSCTNQAVSPVCV